MDHSTARAAPRSDEEDGAGASLPTVSVHMLRFPLGDGARAALLDLDVTVELVVEHPEYADAVPLSADLRSDLAADLGGDGS